MEPFVRHKTAHLWRMLSCRLPVGGVTKVYHAAVHRANPTVSCLSRRSATCRSAWRRCSADISWHTTLTDPWRSASCAIRSSPATTTSKSTWRTCTGRRRARGSRPSVTFIHPRVSSFSTCFHVLLVYVCPPPAVIDQSITCTVHLWPVSTDKDL